MNIQLGVVVYISKSNVEREGYIEYVNQEKGYFMLQYKSSALDAAKTHTHTHLLRHCPAIKTEAY